MTDRNATPPTTDPVPARTDAPAHSGQTPTSESHDQSGPPTTPQEQERGTHGRPSDDSDPGHS